MNIFEAVHLYGHLFTPNHLKRPKHIEHSELLTWHLLPNRWYTCSFSSRVSSI